MPIMKQKWIMRNDLKNNPDVLYIFGDNTVRKGLGGQAKEMRGEANAIGVATKNTPTSGTNSYFSDDDYEKNVKILRCDLYVVWEALKNNTLVVFPADGIGTGLSDLPNKAPKTNAYLEGVIDSMFDAYGV